MICKEILEDGTVCGKQKPKYAKRSTVCWGDYNMCERCCRRLHPEEYGYKFRTVSAYMRELRSNDPELDEFMSSDIHVTKWNPWND